MRYDPEVLKCHINFAAGGTADRCSDDNCDEPHVYVLTANEYRVVNEYIHVLDQCVWNDRGSGPEPVEHDYIAATIAR